MQTLRETEFATNKFGEGKCTFQPRRFQSLRRWECDTDWDPLFVPADLFAIVKFATLSDDRLQMVTVRSGRFSEPRWMCNTEQLSSMRGKEYMVKEVKPDVILVNTEDLEPVKLTVNRRAYQLKIQALSCKAVWPDTEKFLDQNTLLEKRAMDGMLKPVVNDLQDSTKLLLPGWTQLVLMPEASGRKRTVPILANVNSKKPKTVKNLSPVVSATNRLFVEKNKGCEIDAPNKRQKRDKTQHTEPLDFKAICVLTEQGKKARFTKNEDGKCRKIALSPDYFGSENGCARIDLPDKVQERYPVSAQEKDLKAGNLWLTGQLKHSDNNDKVCCKPPKMIGSSAKMNYTHDDVFG